ncbi:MAG: hypothetical protein ACFNYI_06275 [Eubacterium sp.]
MEKYIKCYSRPLWFKGFNNAEESPFAREGFDYRDEESRKVFESLLGHSYREIDNDTARKIVEKNRLFDEYCRTIPDFMDKYSDLLADLDEAYADKAVDPEIKARIEAYNNSPEIRIDPVKTDKEGNVITAAMIEQERKEREAREAEKRRIRDEKRYQAAERERQKKEREAQEAEERKKQEALERRHIKEVGRRILAITVVAAIAIYFFFRT